MASTVLTKPSKGRTATRAARRQQLIEATIDSIAERGFSETTLATVTKRANLSHGLVNFHFKSKEALYVETLGFLAQEHFDHWHRAMNLAGPDPSEKLAAIVEVDFESSICSPKKLAVWFAFWGQAKYRPAYVEVHSKYDELRFSNMTRLCGEIVKSGEYGHIDPAAVARRLEALIDGMWLSLLLYPKAFERHQARDDCLACLSELFPKHFPRPTKPCGA